MAFNLLTEKLIESDNGWHSLPGLMAAMSRGEIASFPALRPHQRPAWHMFLVQLAVMALKRAEHEDVLKDETKWTAALRGLAQGFEEDEPWNLVVEDRSKPAFLQSPDPGGLDWPREKVSTTPDELDMIITSRNHDLKTRVARKARPQDWIYALVSLQTMEGYGGKGNQGIARMNGGSSSRPMLTLAPLEDASSTIHPSRWWHRDVCRLIERDHTRDGISLLWLEPWPEKQQISIEMLNSLFIEVCRRVRLFAKCDSTLSAERANSIAPRIRAKETKGVVSESGEPWAPVNISEAKTLTLSDKGWDYKLLFDLIYSSDYKKPILASPSESEKAMPMALVAEAFSRGNCKTDAFKSRTVVIPKRVIKVLFETQAMDLAKELINDIKNVDSALRDGLVIVSCSGKREQSGEKASKENYKRTNPARNRLERFADQYFFDALFQRLQAKDSEKDIQSRLDFLQNLSVAAEKEFENELPAIPCTRIMRPRAELRGRRVMRSKLKKIQAQINPEKAK